MNILDYKLETLVVDRLKLDGGAMFGSVPKALWSKRAEPDDLNRITLACRLLKISSKNETFLVDLGCGDKWDDKSKQIYAIENLESLPEKIDNVILTHLHFDHVGGITVLDKEGIVEARYKDASYYLSKTQYEHATNSLLDDTLVRDQASFLKENIDILDKLDLNFTVSGKSVAEGIEVHQVNGHTPGLQWIKVSDQDITLAYPSDLVPTSAHIDPLYIMGYDLYAQASLLEKQKFIEQAAAENWIIVFQHDPEIPAATIEIGKSGKVKINKEVSVN